MTSLGPAACAAVTRNHLSYARVLAGSYLEHYAEGRFYLLVLDGLPPGVDLGGRICVVDAEVVCPCYWEMAVRYNALELSCAVKPFLAAAILEKFGEEAVFYFDSDILILRRLVEAERMLQDAEMLLTPHILQPIEPDGMQPDELYILSGGVYNMGFFAIRNSVQGVRLLNWWSSRLREGCRVDLAAGIFLDQRWADLMPALFPSVALLRDVTYNVAFWNLQERRLERSPAGLEVDGRPLSFFHFSGLDLDAGTFRDTHQTRMSVHQGTALAMLIEDYTRLHERNGRTQCRSWGRAFKYFDNGIEFHPLLKRLYLGLDESRRLMFGNPFRTLATESFFNWAIQPDPVVSPFLRTVHEALPELHQQFPDLDHGDLTAFANWARTEGARTLHFSPALVSDPASPKGGPPPTDQANLP